MTPRSGASYTHGGARKRQAGASIPEVSALIYELDELHWTGRRDYGARTLIGARLVKPIYALPT